MGSAVLFETDADEQEDDPLSLDEYLVTNEIKPHTEYQHDPIGWMRDKMLIPENRIRWSLNPGYEAHQWDGTPDPLVVALKAIADGCDVAIAAATGTQKTYTAALVVLWWIACWENAEARTTATTEKQLTDNLWKELKEMEPQFKRHFPAAEFMHLRIRMRAGSDKWGAKGIVAGVRAEESERGSATKAQGAHAEHLLIIPEEAPGIPPAIMRALRNTLTGHHNLMWAQGNPDNQHDQLYALSQLEGVVAVRISALDHPNIVCHDASIVPGAVSWKSVNTRKQEFGEGTPLYESRVRGITPAQAVDALIQQEWLKKAAELWDQRDNKLINTWPGAMGVDVAQSINGDKAAVARGRGPALVHIRAFQCTNATLLGEQLFTEAQNEGIPLSNVGIDPVGPGGQTIFELRKKTGGDRVASLWGSGKPISYAQRGNQAEEWMADENMFNNLRSQMYWQAREDLRLERLLVPKNAELWKQLTAHTYTHTPKVQVEGKDDVKPRLGGKSPDLADAFVYWNWMRPREVRIEKVITPIDPKRDEGAQETEWAQLNPTNPEYQYAAPDESGAFSQFSW